MNRLYIKFERKRQAQVSSFVGVSSEIEKGLVPTGNFFHHHLGTPPKEEEQEDWSLAASQVAKALADAISSSIAEESSSKAVVSSHEPITEVRDGVEWVSFVYSHHRILRRYCIRTDLEKVDINQLDEKFKRDNCVSNTRHPNGSMEYVKTWEYTRTEREGERKRAVPSVWVDLRKKHY